MTSTHVKTGASAPALRSLASNHTRYSQEQRGASFRKKLSESLSEQDVLNKLVIDALWKSFPEEYSEEGIAEAARPYFRNKNGEPISARTIRYWLSGATLPSALHLAALVRMQPKLFLTHWLGVAA